MTSTNPAFSDKAIAALREQFGCPTPFAAARTKVMGAIASPIPSLPRLAALDTLWDGQMPDFESNDDAHADDAVAARYWQR